MAVLFKAALCDFRSFIHGYSKLVSLKRATGQATNKIACQINLVHRHTLSSITQRTGTSQDYFFHARDSTASQENIKDTSNQEDDKAILEHCVEDISSVSPYFPPTFNFAAYVNKSATLQEFVKLGVDLHSWEKRKGIPQFILKLDFQKDIKAYLTFLHDLGVPTSSFGKYLSRNPLIFKEEINDLHVRVNYLLSKQFTAAMVARIVEVNPYWLMFSTQRVDRRLGYFQKTFELTGNQIRELTTKQPRLITYNMNHINLITFVIKEELGFKKNEMQKLLTKRPRLWMMDQTSLRNRFNFVHNEMKIPHEQICAQPQVLGSREFRTKQRHSFLSFLGRAQYDPRLEGYVSLESLVAGTDAEFSLNVAKSSINAFNLFMKTL